MRRDGVRFREAMGAVRRPCEPDDVYKAIVFLYRRTAINFHHVDVLANFGMKERPPDPRIKTEEELWCRWNEALDKLGTILKQKKIVLPSTKS
jgi:hypothetical protein